jgi:ATP-dependent helicase/nuclease subunit A
LFPVPEGLGALEAGPEWVVVQGVVDLAVIREAEIWVLDFKTDRAEDLAAKVERYRPQLQLYAAALERIYRRPVTHCWIHFFSGRQTVALDEQPRRSGSAGDG